MSGGLILAIDQGTTNTKALAVDADGRVVAQASAAMSIEYPKPGWAEQSATDIWRSVQQVIAAVVAQTGPHVDAVAISNQRETVVAWDAVTGAPLAPAITWQCRRSTERCEAIKAAGHAQLIASKTGLGLDPLFPAAKIGWLIDNVSDVRDAADRGTLRLGTVDSWLLWNFTGGKRARHRPLECFAHAAARHRNAAVGRGAARHLRRAGKVRCPLSGLPTATLATSPGKQPRSRLKRRFTR